MSANSIRLLADQAIYKLDSFLPPQIKCNLFDSAQGIPSTLGFDALLIRTVSSISQKWIQENKHSLQFIGTASAGFDHVDTSTLKKNAIKFVSASGCNALAVAEYVLTSLLIWADEKKVDLQEKSLAIIGVGYVGKQVNRLAKKLGITTVLYDPPREKRSKLFKSASLEEVKACDFISFHVPYNSSTHHFYSEKKFRDVSFSVLINAARGGVVDESFVLRQLTQQKIGDVFIDCWENEPIFNSDLARKAFICTPHIAGYSEQAKLKATELVVKKMCVHFGINQTEKKPESAKIFHIDANQASLSSFLRQTHGLQTYHELLKSILNEPDSEKKRLFSSFRVNTPYRNEYKSLVLPHDFLLKFPTLNKLGFTSL